MNVQEVLVGDQVYGVVGIKNGGMGRVWLLRRLLPNDHDAVYRTELAVKTFDFTEDETAIRRELNVWISLVHPGILKLITIGHLDYRLAAIMPRMDDSLEGMINSTGPLEEREVVRALVPIVEALAYAHAEHGILHLDIKPSNVLITGGSIRRILVSDWGISRHASSAAMLGFQDKKYLNSPEMLTTSYSAGTPLFMSPERFSGNWVMSIGADIYSAGMMALFLRFGVLPFSFGQTNPLHEIFSGQYLENANRLLARSSRRFRKMVLAFVDSRPDRRPSTYRQALRLVESI